MKNLLIVLIGLFVLIGCSKSFKEVKPDPIEDPIEEFPSIMEIFEISPNDTVGLKLFGVAAINTAHKSSILGNKNGYLWVQILEPKEDNTFKKITNFTTTAKFNDRIEIDLGYGEKKVVKVDYINWDDKILGGSYIINWHDQEHFSLNTISNSDIVFAWVICKNKIFEHEIYYKDTFVNGYTGLYGDNETYVFNETGEPLYRYGDEYKDYTFINLYEYINYSPNKLYRQNAKTKEIIWGIQLEKMGQVIDGHEPKIEHSIKITGEYAECTFNITNYDGSRETKKYNVDIETGEIIEK